MNRALFAIALFLTGAAVPLAAQPVPRLTGVAPIYLRQGESREITVTGQNLGDARSVLLVDEAGLTAALLPVGKATEPRKLRLTAGPHAELGDRELRLVTPVGVTQPVTVTVGQLPAAEEIEPNDSTQSAQRVTLPASIHGRIDRPGDIDCYQFKASKGQHLVFDVHALRLGAALEAVLTIRDAQGHELPGSKTFHAGDPTAVLEVPADGDYVLEIRDLRYRGGDDYAYGIEAGEIPFVESLLPMSGAAGQKLKVIATGHNLRSADDFLLDLTNASPGAMPVRVTTPTGLSNEVTFFVTGSAIHTGSGSMTAPVAPSTRPVIAVLPWEETGVLAEPGVENSYRLKTTTRQPVTISINARGGGSPVDALLSLKSGTGQLIEQSNGAADFEAKISRQLEPGDYVISVRDLTFAGGPSYTYRLTCSAEPSSPEFDVRFMPDAIRVPRGGSAKVWCEVNRAGGVRGPVKLEVGGLPAGVTLTPAVIDESTSGIVTLSARAGAESGTFPLRITATAANLTRTADAELSSRVVRQAYVTVTEPAPFTVDTGGAVKPEDVAEYPKQVARLQAMLGAAGPQIESGQAEWEKQFRGDAADGSHGQPAWVVLTPSTLESLGGATLTREPDGSIRATGTDPEKDTFTFTATTALKSITSIRLEALADSNLPANGPGRAPNGNFVLSQMTVTAGPQSDPGKAVAVSFVAASATFEQQQYPAASAVGAAAGGGWAVVPETGKSQVAVFRLATPVGFEGGTTLRFSLDQQYGGQHVIGRWRLSVSSDPKAAVQIGGPSLAPKLLAIVQTAPAARTASQKADLSAYYRSISPELAAARSRLETLRQTVGPVAEIARLEAILASPTPQLDAERLAWEKSALAGGWVPVDVTHATGTGGVLLTKETDHSLLASGANPTNSIYTISAGTSLTRVTGVRLEVLPDERLPGGGPGRAADGNFILTAFKLRTQPLKKAAESSPQVAVKFVSASADYEQKNYAVGGTLDDDPATGWAIAPHTARPLSAVYSPAAPIDGADAQKLIFTLEQEAPLPQYTLGRFRLWVTAGADPKSSTPLPPEVVATLKIPVEQRTEEQNAALAAYHRSVAQSLSGVRQRLVELRSALVVPQLATARNRTISIAVRLTRRPGFTGDVQVTLEGFAAGRDPVTRQPVTISKFFVVTPLTIKGTESFGKLSVKVNGNSEVGTRMVVLRAETKVGADGWVQYSPAFPLTVSNK